MLQKGIRAHGGQAATAGAMVQSPQVNAVFRGTTREIRVWDGHGEAEEFTIAEARHLCVRGDQALLDGWSECGRLQTGMWVGSEGEGEFLICGREWLIAFLASVRRALRAADTAALMSRQPYAATIDDESEPGSWQRHLRHTSVIGTAIG